MEAKYESNIFVKSDHVEKAAIFTDTSVHTWQSDNDLDGLDEVSPR